MLQITKSLREHLVSLGLPAGATDEQARAFTAKEITTADRLTPEKVSELVKKDSDEKSQQTKTLIKDAVRDVLTERVNGGQPANTKGTTMQFSKTEDVFGGSAAGGDGASLGDHLRVKAPSEMYCNTKSIGKHVRTGEPVYDERGKAASLPSQLEKAKAGVFFKFLALKQAKGNVSASFTEYERNLLEEMYQKDSWCGIHDKQLHTGKDGVWAKALLNDALSGGVEVSPEWFDDMIVTFPLPHSEILPFVTLRDVPRGSAVESASIGNPTVTWGTSEGTGVTLFTTDSLLGEVNTSIHPVMVAVEMGRDFLADAAVNVGNILVANIGQRMLSELDRVVAYGNGSSEPQGILNTSGISALTPAGGNGTAIQLDDVEAMQFAVGKQYRSPQYRCGYIGNDTVYSRVRGIPVGASDERRIFGMDHGSYKLLDHPYRVNNTPPNTHVAFGSFASYWLYRRQAAEYRWITEDLSLARANKIALTVRGRFGGRVSDTSAWSRIATLIA